MKRGPPATALLIAGAAAVGVTIWAVVQGQYVAIILGVFAGLIGVGLHERGRR